MAIGSWLAAGVLAIGAQWFANGPWSPLDLPYPEVDEPAGVGVSGPGAEAQVAASAAAWAARLAPGRKPEVTEIKVDGTRATAKASVAGRSWTLRLERVGQEWRVQEK